jgi:hypothetical protein
MADHLVDELALAAADVQSPLGSRRIGSPQRMKGRASAKSNALVSIKTLAADDFDLVSATECFW